MKNILIVEDESIIALEIERYVKSLGYSVVGSVSNCNDCVDKIKNSDIDLVLMDVYIKGSIDGIECVDKIREIQTKLPVIYISAFSDDATLDRAVDTKPNAYLIKPFNRDELRVAIKIALKEKDKFDRRVGDIAFDEEISFDSKNEELIINSQAVHLTKKELKLLKLFIKLPNRIISYYDIENEIWFDKEVSENTRRSLIARLRAKLNYKFIKTVHSIGYRFR